MGFGRYVVLSGALRFGEVDVPWTMPPWAILALFCAFIGNTVSGVMTFRGATECVGAFEVSLLRVLTGTFGWTSWGRSCSDKVCSTRVFLGGGTFEGIKMGREDLGVVLVVIFVSEPMLIADSNNEG